MEIKKLTDENAIETMKTHLEHALDDPKIRVFQILGYFGIGKRTAVRSVLNGRGIEPVEHHYTVIETEKPIVAELVASPDEVHIWDDVFRSNIMHPEVLAAFQKIQDGTIKFNGTFLLVANDKEFPEYNFPPFPGVHIEFENNAVFLQYLERQVLREGRLE